MAFREDARYVPPCRRPHHSGRDWRDQGKITDYVQLMRWRINLLDLAKRGCFYDELMDKVFGKGGVWEIK